MGEKPHRKSRVKFWIVLLFSVLVLDVLASGPYRALARNKRMSRSTYAQLQPFFIPAQYAAKVPLLGDVMGVYWDWWTKMLKT